MLDKELCSLLRQLKKSVGRLGALPDINVGEDAIKIALRPGTDPDFHLRFSQFPGEFLPSMANPCPNRIGQREMLAPYPFVYQGVEFPGVRRFVSPENQQFSTAGNDGRMALKGIVSQSAKGTLGFSKTASLHI